MIRQIAMKLLLQNISCNFSMYIICILFYSKMIVARVSVAGLGNLFKALRFLLQIQSIMKTRIGLVLWMIYFLFDCSINFACIT